jgi:hypothetical protein
MQDDPRLPLLAAGVLVGWVSMGPIGLPGTRMTVPAPLEALQGVVPGLDAIRAGMSIGDGVQLIVMFLAGVGAAQLLTACPRRARGIAATALVAVTLLEVVVPGSTGAFPGPRARATWAIEIPDDLLDLTARLPDGAVLDLPYEPSKASVRRRAHYLLLRAFHLRPTAACHNSFASPLGNEIGALVRRLPDPRAADALHALGFRSVVVHHEEAPDTAGPAVEELRRLGRAREVGRAIGHTAYALETPLPTRTDLDLLTPDPPPGVVGLGREAKHLTFTFFNPATAIYRHPDPLEPMTCLIRWYAAAGQLVATERQRVLLPLAMGAGDRVTRTVATRLPVAAGDYEVTLAPAEAPEAIVGRLSVRIEPRGG